MDAEVLKSYLVSLGFQVDQPQLTRFEQTIKDVEKQVESHVEGVGRAFLVMGATIASAYAAVGSATVALMDHVSQAEIGYQLFSMRMYMATDAGKKLKISMDALGHSIEEIAMLPELQGRLRTLFEDQTRLQAGLGPDYQQRMRELRDIRFEFTRIQVALQYAGMAVVNNLSKALGLDDSKIQGWVEWLINHIPELSEKFSNFLVPILKDLWSIMKDVADIGTSFATVFAHVFESIVSIFDGGKVNRQTGELEKFTTAVDEVSHALARLVDFVDQHKQLLGMIGGAVAGGYIGSFIGPEGTVVGAVLGGVAGAAAGDAASRTGGAGSGAEGLRGNDAAEHAKYLAQMVSAKTGIPAQWIFAQWAHETDYFTSKVFQKYNNLGGIRQGEGYRQFGSMDDSAAYFGKLMMLDRYKDARGAGNMDDYAYKLKYNASGMEYYEDSYANYDKGMHRWEGKYGSGGGDTHVGGITVNIHNPHNADEAYHAAVRGVRDGMGDSAQRQLAETGTPIR